VVGEVAAEEGFAEGEQAIGALVGAGPVGDRIEPIRITIALAGGGAGGALAVAIGAGGGWAGGGVDGGDDGGERVGVVGEVSFPGPVQTRLEVDVGPLDRAGLTALGEVGTQPVDLDAGEIDQPVGLQPGQFLMVGEAGIERFERLATQRLGFGGDGVQLAGPDQPVVVGGPQMGGLAQQLGEALEPSSFGVGRLRLHRQERVVVDPGVAFGQRALPGRCR
jgi:hypothetical protein